MSKLRKSPHDQMFRDSFSSPKAAGLLFSEHLPKHMVTLFKPETLECVHGTFFGEQFRERRADLLFRVELKDGGHAYIYVLVEHKSRNDRMTPLQLLTYMNTIWLRLRKDGAALLPPIIPVVFHHGPGPWSAPPAFHGLIDRPVAALKPFTVQFRYHLIDLNRIDDDRLSHDPDQRLLLAALKCATRDDMREEGLRRVASQFAEASTVAIVVVLRYILECRHDIGEDDVDRALGECAPERKEEVMNVWIKEIGDKAFAKGKIEGEAKGRTEGKIEGRTEGKIESLLTLLDLRFGCTPPDVAQRIRESDPQTIDRWIRSVIDAKTIADVIGH